MNGKGFRHGVSRFLFLSLCLYALFFTSCNNFFNNLVPPDETRILSFDVPGQIGPASISGTTVTVAVAKGTDRSDLVPSITVSPKASCIPLTLAYLSRTFPGTDILQEATAIYQTRDLSAYVIDLIKRTPNFAVPVLDDPIDFTGPVQFLVIGGRGTIQQHTVNVTEHSEDPVLLGFSFAKYDNPELIRDAAGVITTTTNTVQINALYPMEMPLSYSLIPSFEIFGEKLEIDGVEIQSGIDAIQFDQMLGTQTKTITVTRNGEIADYTLSVEFTEDPDSIRSIIDFRFNKAGNPGIAANAVGSIMNNNALGTITVQVFYTGARPSVLTPAFLSPGTVSVAGITQTSGVSSQDFSQTLEYRVVSRNNLYTRTYTVRVDLIDAAAASPRITVFRFSAGLNPELVQDTDGSISESAGLILITARYGGSFVPGPLAPEFQATGIVSVWGAVQISGSSSQDFSIQVKYTVADPVNTLLKRDYWVQVSFTRDTSSDAKINAFSFHPDENSGLADEIEGRIDQNAGTITVFAPIGSGVTQRTMIPRFRAIGQVEVEGVAQTSGITGHLFNAPVVYEAVSANGANRKTYTVTVRELQTTIFVNQNAYGMGDGTSWQDAFRSLQAACEAAAEFPPDVPKEIWIAAGTYKPSTSGNSTEYFLLAPTTNYIGGFAGSETAKSQRNVAANKVIISGELGGGVYSNNLFGAFNGNTAATVNGDVFIEDMEFTSVRAGGSGDRANGAAISATLLSGSELRITGCEFNDLQAPNGGMVYSNGGKLALSDTVVNNITVRYGVYGNNLSGAAISDLALQDIGYGLYFTNSSGDIELNNLDLRNIAGDGLYFTNCSGDIEIDGVTLQDIVGRGIYSSGGSGKREFSHIAGNGVGGRGVELSGGGNSVILADSNFDTGGGINMSSSGSPIGISRTTVKNISGAGISTSGGNTIIENVVVENVTNGTGMSLTNNGSIRVSGSTIRDVQAPSGSGIALLGSGSAVISNTTIENITASDAAIAVNIAGDLTIVDSAINRVVSNNYGLYLTGSGNTVIANTSIKNINATSSGSVIYAVGRRLVIEDTTIDNITAQYGVYGTGLTGVKISDLSLQDIGNGLNFINCSGDVEINRIDLQNITNNGIYITGSSGKRELANITGYNLGNNITGNGNSVYILGGSGVVSLTESNFDTAVTICISNFNSTASINISDTNIKNVASENAIFTSEGNIVIERVNIENVPNGRGIQMNASGTGRITDSNIKNCTTSNLGGGIYSIGTGGVTISGTTIENVEASNGGGIYSIGEGTLTISDSTIKNARSTTYGGGVYVENSDLTIKDYSMIKNAKAGRFGGGIYYNSSKSLVISDTMIEDVEVGNSGGGIQVTAAFHVNISNTTIKNARAGSSGGGFSSNPVPLLVITGSRFENCRANNDCGAIGSIASSFDITNTTFLNCTAGIGTKIITVGQPLTFKGCTFEDNDELYKYDPRTGGAWNMFGSASDSYFENCTFNNLTDIYTGISGSTGENYIFRGFVSTDTFSHSADQNLTLKNCTFNLSAGSAGLLFLSADGYNPSHLLMENVTINNNGCQQPLIWLYGNNPPGTFQFKNNNVYNGIPLNTQSAITGLAGSGVIRLTNGATPVLVP